MRKKIIRDKTGNNVDIGDILSFQKNNNEISKYSVVRDNNGKLKAVPMSDNGNLIPWGEDYFQYMYIVG